MCIRDRCKEVQEVDDRIREILDDMTETLHATPNGAAIAASQVGILKRLVVIDMGTGLMKLVNPVIVESVGEQDCVEGCLSFPDKFGRTVRPQAVVVKALNETGEEAVSYTHLQSRSSIRKRNWWNRAAVRWKK